MSEWTAKRFWTKAGVASAAGGYEIRLDDRPIRTPGRRALIVPSRAMAEAAAEEWLAQGEIVDPRTMPVTRSANSAIDQTGPAREAVIDMLASYGETDLLCYRAEGPERLVARQADAWDPLLAWSGRRYGAPLVAVMGIVPAAQPRQSLDRLRDAIAAYEDFALTALHDLVLLSGSLVLGLAAAEDEIGAESAWQRSRIDEDWQIEQWGEDADDAAMTARKHQDFLHAKRFLALARSAGNPRPT